MHLMYFTEQPMSTYPAQEGLDFGATALMFSNKHFDPVSGSRAVIGMCIVANDPHQFFGPVGIRLDQFLCGGGILPLVPTPLTVDHDIDEETSAIELLVSGEVSAQNLGAIANRLVSQSEELLDVEPNWQDGMIGVMQLVVTAQAAQILRERAS